MKKAVFCIVLFSTVLYLSAQVLPQAQEVPSADGIVEKGEYPFIKTAGKADIGIALSSDSSVLYMFISVPTEGWVALGLGSLKMDGSFMVFAFDNEGKISITEETGKGKLHSINKTSILQTSAVKEKDGITVLEFSVKSADFVKNGKLDFIAAYGNRDSRTSIHTWKSPVSVQIQ